MESRTTPRIKFEKVECGAKKRPFDKKHGKDGTDQQEQKGRKIKAGEPTSNVKVF